MWILIFLFFCFIFLIFWICLGYFIWLFLLGLIKDRKAKEINEDKESLPFISIIVPCLNEEIFILGKIENLKSLDYPSHRLEILFIDGGSADRTKEIINSNKLPCMHLLETNRSGKIPQLNLAIKKSKGEFIVITDVDGIMSSNTIKEIAKEFIEDKDICVVGVYSYPDSDYLIDRYYWLTQNKARLIESKAFVSSIVIAQGYAFRKGLLSEFPEDVIADDVYISFLANSLGYKTFYIDTAFVKEKRVPKNIQELIVHKFRKSNAFLRESLRFLYMLPQMNNIWKIMFLTKLFQLLFLPWLVILSFILAVSLITMGRWDIVLSCMFFSLISSYIVHKIYDNIKPGHEERIKFPLTVKIKTFLLSNFILFVNGISFMFFKQTSNYRRING